MSDRQIVEDLKGLKKDGVKISEVVNSTQGVLNLQGKQATFTTIKNSDQIVLTSKEIPSLNGVTISSKTNPDGTKTLASTELKNYLTSNKAEILDTVNNGAVSGGANGLSNHAGNPASHVAQMSYYDSVIDGNGVAAGNGAGAPAESRFSSSFRFSNYSQNSDNAKLYTVSLGYNWELGNGLGLLFNMPLTYVDTTISDATHSSGRVSVGAGLRIPVSEYLHIDAVRWDVVPLLRGGAVGLGNKIWNNTSIAYSGGVQSNVGRSLGYGFTLVVQNQYTYNTDASQYSPRPPDTNVSVFRNGFLLAKDFSRQWFGKTVTASFTFADVRFDSNKPGLNNQQEFGFNVGLKDHDAAPNLLRLNVTYTNATNYDDTVSVNLGGAF